MTWRGPPTLPPRDLWPGDPRRAYERAGFRRGLHVGVIVGMLVAGAIVAVFGAFGVYPCPP